VLGPLFFVTYIFAIARITEKFNVLHDQYADVTQLYVALSKTLLTNAVSNLQNCVAAVRIWFSQNGLVINLERSEAVLLCTVQQSRAAALPLNDVNVADCVVPFTRYWA